MLLKDYVLGVSEYDNFEVTSINFKRDKSLSFLVEKQGEVKESIEIICEGIVDSNISLLWRSLDFEGHELIMSNDEVLLWKYGYYSKIFCSEPLPNPEGFFCLLSDYLLKLGLKKSLVEYLRSSFEGWRERVSHKEYQLIEAPVQIAEFCEKLLQQQGIRYKALKQPHPADKRKLSVVWIGESWIICESAYIRD